MLKLIMLISALSGHRGYTHGMHGNYQLERRFPLFKTVDVLSLDCLLKHFFPL